MNDKKLIPMEELIVDSPSIFLPKPGSIVEGAVITVHNNRVLVDLGGVSTGIIAGREAVDSNDTVKSLLPGDEVSAFVLEPENDEGLIVLSLRRASQHKTWKKFVDIHDNKEAIDVRVTDANKGGLLVEVDGIKGFLPVSQLAPKHYPRVNGADSAKILGRLNKLVGQDILVRVINADHETRKLILSEKAAYYEQRKKALGTVEIGQVVTGEISGVVNFGIFVTFNGLEGLVHISEIAWGHVDNPSNYGKLGDKIEVKVIGIEGDKISLSLKKMIENPWDEIAKAYTPGMEIKGRVSRITEYGAFVNISDDINGLIHISEINDPRVKDSDDFNIEVGEKIISKILHVDKDNHRIGLTLLDAHLNKDQKLPEVPKEEGKKEAKKTKVTKEESAKVADKKQDTEVKKEESAKVADKKQDTEVKKDESAKEQSFDDLKLSKAAQKALEAAGITNVNELKATPEDQLTKIDGLTTASVKKILAA